MARAPRQSWLDCVRDQLKQRGFGDKRADEIETQVKNLADRYRRSGEAMPEDRATREVMAGIAKRTAARSADALNTMEHIAETKDRIQRNTDKAALRSFGGKGLAPIAESYFDRDSRVGSDGSGDLRTNEDLARQRLMRIGGQIATDAGKNYWGLQRGKAHLPNIAREVLDGFGTTGDKVAESLARAWVAMTDEGVRLFNAVGGHMDSLPNYMPQNWSAARVTREGEEAYVQFHARPGVLDWDRMSHPDGTPIAPAEREQYLRDVWRTIIQDGANKLTPESAAGRGANVANQLESHRQLHYANAAAWLEAFDRYSDGTIFNLMMKHVASMTRQIALVQTFGVNPTAGVARIRAQVVRAAADHAPGDAILVRRTEDGLRGSFGYDAQARSVLDRAPGSEFSTTGQVTAVAASLLRAAQLGSSVIVSAPTDIAHMMHRRWHTGQKNFLLGGMGDYLRTFAEPLGGGKKLAGVYARIGYIHDDMLNGLWDQNMRFFDPVGRRTPGIANGIAGSVWRLSLQAAHDTGIRRAILNEQMGFLHDMRGRAVDKLPEGYASLLRRHGVTEADWDAFRTQCPETTLGKGAKWLAPINILDTQLPNREDLFRKFGGMIQTESYFQFMDRPTVGAMAWARNARADSLMGLIATSALMYKSFPLTVAMTHARHAMVVAPFQQSENALVRGAGRAMYWAGLVGTLATAGALVVQAQHIRNGQDPEPVATPQFAASAILAGGGLGLMGDALKGGTQDNGRGISDVASGPILELLGSAINTGGVWARWGLGMKTGNRPTTGADAVLATGHLAESVLPGSSLWFARLALQRMVLDRFEAAWNPQAYQKWRTQQNNARRNGSPFYWRPGQNAADRMPNLGSFGGQ